jgi:heptosyltransferase III
VIDDIAARGLAVVLTGAPDPAETPLISAINAATSAPHVDLTGRLSMPELSALIANARLFVGCDTAPMHLAAAAGTPVVAWFGPSDERIWGPWRVPHRVVASDVHPCRPCHNNGCGGSNQSDCLLTLPQVRVIAAIDELLNETAT